MSVSMVVDDDVKAVVEFMQSRVAARRLVPVADGLAALAPLLWGRFQPEAIQTIRLEAEPITAAAADRPAASSE